MPSNTLQPLYAYCIQPPQDVIQSVFALAREKERLIGTGIPVIPKMFVHIDALYSVLLNYSPNDPLALTDLSAVSWLETIVIRQFITHSEDVENRDILATELRYAAAAIGALPRVTPYTPDELALIGSGKANFYDPITLVLTSRMVAGMAEPTEYIPFFYNQLLLHASIDEKFNWEQGFVLAAIIRCVWMQFMNLEDAQQILLFQNYLYTGITVGVPIETILEYALNAGYASNKVEDMNTLYVMTADENKEVVPLKINGGLGRSLATILKAYVVKYGEQSLDEKYIAQYAQTLYQSAPNAIALSGWLQDTLKIYRHLYNGDFLPAQIKAAA